MNKFKGFGIGFISLFVQIASIVALADTPPANVFTVNPTTLRQRMLDSNLSIVLEYVNLKTSKDRVGVARGNLMPGVSLNATTFTSFGISEIQYLMPFLIPSNWFNYSVSKHQLEAEKFSFYIVELNTYASGLGAYFSALADYKALPFWVQEAKDYRDLADNDSELALKGLISPLDVKRANAAADAFANAASNVQIAIVTEQELLRNLLNITDPHTNIVLDPVDLPESEYETKDIDSDEAYAFKVAPERLQNDALILADQANAKGTAFSFISGAQFSGSSSGGGIASLTGGIGVTLTPSIIPNYHVALDSTAATVVQGKIISDASNQTVATTLAMLDQTKFQLKTSADGESNAKDVYESDQELYLKGQISFTQLKQDSIAFAVATLQRITAEQNINLARVTFERTFLIDQFAPIKMCTATKLPNKKTGASLDQLCKRN